MAEFYHTLLLLSTRNSRQTMYSDDIMITEREWTDNHFWLFSPRQPFLVFPNGNTLSLLNL